MNHRLSVAATALALVAIPLAAQPAATSGKTLATVTTQLPRTVRPDHYDVTIVPDAAALTFTGTETIDLEVLSASAAITYTRPTSPSRTSSSPPPTARPSGRPRSASTPTAKPRPSPSGGRSRRRSTGWPSTMPARSTPRRPACSRSTTKPPPARPAARSTPSSRTPTRAGSSPRGTSRSTRRLHPPRRRPRRRHGGEQPARRPPRPRRPRQGPRHLRRQPADVDYLLFFGLGDFERATRTAGGTEIGVVAKRGDLPQAQFALNAAAAILPWYNDYFGTPFPLPKLDHIAAPGQSQFFSAMENWGAIFYFENVILLDPKIASARDRQHIFVDFAHEMAHQWFGDLVTMAWWDDLWLNEGFASWMESRAAAHFHPEWHPELTAVGTRDGAMSVDALATTHPVVQHVATVEAASQAFDAITYSKGEAVIAMLEAYTGPTAWRDGVRRYMARYAHQNTVTDDLWREIEAASGKPIRQIAHDFTLQPGIPLVRAAATCAGGTTTLTLDQGEFTKDRPDKTPLAWHVPVIAAAPGGAPVATLLAGHGTLTVPGCGAVVVNAGQSGYYRTLYAPAAFAAVAGAFPRAAPIDQLGLLADAAALGFAGLQPVTDVLDLTQSLPADATPQVTERAAEVFRTFYAYADGVPARQAGLTRFATTRLRPVLDRLGWSPKPGEADNDGNLRNTLIAALGLAGEPGVVAEANRRFAASATDPAAIAPSVRATLLAVVARHADRATWDRLRAMAKAETSVQVRTLLYSLLGMADDPALARQALDLALTAEPGATTGAGMIRVVAQRHPDMAYDFAIAHRAAVMALVDVSSATRVVPALGALSADPAMIAKLRAYRAAYLPAGATRPADEAIAAVEYRIKVRAMRMPAVDAWLAANHYAGGA